MAEFRYRAIDAGGRERSGQVSADDQAAARATLERRKLYEWLLDPIYSVLGRV